MKVYIFRELNNIKYREVYREKDFLQKLRGKNMPRSRRMFQIKETDEYKHEWNSYKEHHNESWYFNFIDFQAKTHMVTRVGYRLGAQEMDTMVLLVIDEDIKEYYNRVNVEGFPSDDIYGDSKLKYECLVPMKKWRMTFDDENYNADIIFEERFVPYFYMSKEGPREIIKKYGPELLAKLMAVAASKHYEQGMKVSGIVRSKDTNEEHNINCFGHRDRSWGNRDYLLIDKWNWIACQFDDCTINSSRIEVFGHVITQGFISTAENQEQVTNVEVETEYGYQGNDSVPKKSTFKITTPTKELEIVSNTSISFYIHRPTEKGITEVYEQIVNFEMAGKKGVGISEYMKSTRNE